MKNGKFAASDIETNHWIHFLMIGFYDGEVYTKFTKLDEYMDYVLRSENNGMRIYFHNGGRFDFLFLAEKLMERGIVKFVNKSSGLLGMVYSDNRVRVEFWDSYALFPASLDKLIKTYDIEHKKIAIDFTKIHKANDKVLSEHLKNDCYALYDILRKFIEREGYISNTIAGHALRKFRENFFNGYFWNVSENFDLYFRKNYYKGGRVEVYKMFGKNLNYYDVNSLYPSVMLEKMPVGTPIKTKKYKEKKIGFYQIELLEDYITNISILCEKTKNGNYYINGKKGEKYYLTSIEIEGIRKEVKIKIIDGYYFEDSADVFTGYVNYYFEIKKNAKDESERYLSKLMLNSLYGKFGQRLTGQNIEMNTGKQGDAIIYDVENDLLLVDVKRKIKFRGVYIAAWITALARMKHYEMMKKIGFENIYYCDTDSIVTSKKIKNSDKIGELKLEAEIKEGVFLMPKVYGYIDKKGNEIVHAKGFDKKLIKYAELKKLLIGKLDKIEIASERMLGFKESIKRKNDIKDSAGTFLKMVDAKKELKMNYIRRKLKADKKNIFITEPFFSCEIEKK